MNLKFKLLFLLLISSCSTDLKNTVVFPETIENEFENIYNFPNQTAKFEIVSYTSRTSDMQGIILYSSSNQLLLNQVDSIDINTFFPNISNKPAYQSLTPPTILNYENVKKQLTTISNYSLNGNEQFFSSTLLFKSSIWGAIHNNEGYKETPNSSIIKLSPKNQTQFRITNSIAPGAIDISFGYVGNTVTTTGISISILLSNIIVTGTNRVVALLQTTGTTKIISKGHIPKTGDQLHAFHNFDQQTYENSATPLPENIYLVKDGNSYFKFYITEMSPNLETISNINDNLILNITAFYSTFNGATSF